MGMGSYRSSGSGSMILDGQYVWKEGISRLAVILLNVTITLMDFNGFLDFVIVLARIPK